MIPHMSSAPFSAPAGRNPVRKHVEPGYIGPSLRRGGSAELLDYERGDPSTEGFGLRAGFCLGKHPNEGLRAGGTDEDAALAFEVCVDLLDSVDKGLRQRAASLSGQILLDLRVALHDGGSDREGAAAERRTEEERRGEPIARHVIAETDDVTRLLAAEDPPLAVERLEDVAVADVGRDDADAAIFHQPVEAEVGHRRHRNQIDTEVQCEYRDDLIAVDDVPVLVDSEHAITVAVECNAEMELAARHELLQSSKIGGTAADVDVVAVRLVADRLDLGTELLERLRRDVRVRAVRAVDCDSQPTEIGAEALEYVLQIAVDCDIDAIDLSAAARCGVEQCLDLLFVGVAKLVPVAIEELHTVVLRRVVRCRDDDAEVET